MRSLSQALAAVAVVACIAPVAWGQPAPSASPPKGAAPPPLPAAPAARPPAAPSGSAAPQGSAAPSGSAAPQLPAPDVPKPPTIDVDDPALAPVAAPTHTIQGFKEVLNLLSNQSITMKIAQQEILKAEGSRRQALSGVMPTVTGSAKVSYDVLASTTVTPGPTLNASTCVFAEKTSLLNCFDPAKDPYTVRPDPVASVSLSVTQPFSARSWYAIGTSDEVIAGTKLRAEDARRTAIATAANAIVLVVTNERIAEVNRVGLRAALERLELTKRKKRLGSGTDLDIVRAEQDATTARGSIVTGDETLRKARESLGQIFNSTDTYGVPTGFSLNDIDSALRSACKTDAVENRTDVLAAKSDLKVAERGVTDVKLQYAPTVSVSSVLSYTTTSGGGSSTSGTSLGGSSSSSGASWSIAALLTVPIWDGGARYGAAKIASAQVEEAKLKVQQTVVGATIEATQAQRSVTVAEQARDNSQKARDLAKETARLSQIAFETGTGTSLDLVTSGQALRQAEIDLAVKELQVVQAKIAALLALSKCDV
ncbi:MAG: TolC family protein [Polyangiaceae bacterium]